jgi:acetyltransferase-like isoleucine patch superfamily enzyme
VRALFENTLRKLKRDKDLPLSALARKGATHVVGLVSAPVWLFGVNRVGSGVRTVGRPRIDNAGHMEIGDRVTIRSVPVPAELTTTPGARLTIGSDTFVNYGASLGATGSIMLGARVNVGPYVMIIDTQFHDLYDRSLVPPPQPVVIEDDVFLGAKCSVLPGVRIGRGAVVGTGSVVTKDVEAFTIVAGVPAREIKRLDPSRFVVR